MWRTDDLEDPHFTDTLELDLGDVVPSLAGPKRPKIALNSARSKKISRQPCQHCEVMFRPTKNNRLKAPIIRSAMAMSSLPPLPAARIRPIPGVMLGAGLVAKKAVEKGISPKPWVKTSLAPGSKVVTDYLAKADLQQYFDQIGYDLVGYGCTTCIGNSGPLPAPIAQAVDEGGLAVASVLSGNRNFEGRVHPQVKANYLASPPLVVAYSLAGTLNIDLTSEPLGEGTDGPVYLADVWPTPEEVNEAQRTAVNREMFETSYADVFAGDEKWRSIGADDADMTYDWDIGSTYVRLPPYFQNMPKQAPETVADVHDARILAMLGDSITTDHISPAGSIARTSPAADYLQSYQIRQQDYNSYGSRRGNHEVMMRGTFANIRLKNEMAEGKEGGWTKLMPSGEIMSIYDAAMKYQEQGTPLVIFGGKEYGTGSSRDWAAKGTNLLGVKAVITESFERIHRSNLVGMGVLPLNFTGDVTRKTLGLDGSETVSITGLEEGLTPRMTVGCRITKADGGHQDVELLCRLDTADEVEYYRHGGILHYVLRMLLEQSDTQGSA